MNAIRNSEHQRLTSISKKPGKQSSENESWRFTSIFLQTAAAACMLLLSGCMVGPKYQRPSAPVPQTYKEQLPEGFKEAQGWKPAQPSDAALRGKWWELYGDPALNALEEQISISNQNVLAFEAQYREATDVVRIARAS